VAGEVTPYGMMALAIISLAIRFASQAGAWGRYIGFCLGYGHIWKTYYELDLEKYSARPITLAHDEILTNGILLLKRGTLREGGISKIRAYFTRP
jgi:hypothetical protein